MVYLNLEKQLWQAGYRQVMGVDEVGRGCLAGPVVVAGVIWPRSVPFLDGVTDSKRLSATKRQELAQAISDIAQVCVSIIPVADIDRLNIRQATLLGMRQVIEQAPSVDYALIDGVDEPMVSTQTGSLIQGDSRCYSIATASIVAKVYRDNLMQELGQSFPQYGWAANKGYGTLSHRRAIHTHGCCKHHRTQFVRKILSTRP